MEKSKRLSYFTTGSKGTLCVQDNAGSSGGSTLPTETGVAGLSLSDDTKAQATNGHAHTDEMAAAGPAAANALSAADTSAEEPECRHASSAPAAAPLTQDALIEADTCAPLPHAAASRPSYLGLHVPGGAVLCSGARIHAGHAQASAVHAQVRGAL